MKHIAKLLFAAFLSMGISQAISAQTFYLDANGVTIKCIDCQAGDTGDVDGTIYTAVDNAMLQAMAEDYQNQDFTTVCTTLVSDMSELFENTGATFNQNIGNWDVSNVTTMHQMFRYCLFNQDISQWDVSSVTDMSQMFSNIPENNNQFNQNLGAWNVSNVTNMSGMFTGAIAFNQDIGDWDVSNVTDMSGMFSRAYLFNQAIGAWDVSNVTNMGSMFYYAEAFNQAIGSWDVSSVNNMESMFSQTESFNQDIGGWDVSNVTSMNTMFGWANAFNQNIGGWNVSNVTVMINMFNEASSFNQDLGDWNVSNVGSMINMFKDSPFNQDLSGWCVPLISGPPNNFATNLDPNYYPAWGTCPSVGCTDENACNFSPSAIEDDGSCTYPEEEYLDCEGDCLNDFDGDGICDEAELEGCQDPEACNYDPLATDEGECEYVTLSVIEGNVTPVLFETTPYTCTFTEGSTYQWTVEPGVISSGQESAEVQVVWSEIGSGEICVIETTSTGCVGAEVCVNIAVIPTGIEEVNASQFSIYPNPASTSITISTDAALLNSPYRITDAQGKLVMEGVLRNTTTVLNTDQLSNGQYTLTIISEDTVITKPLIIQK